MWLIVELASASRFELPSNVFLVFHYVNCLFIPNPQGHRLFPNSMTTVVQSGPGEKAEWRNGGMVEWRNCGMDIILISNQLHIAM